MLGGWERVALLVGKIDEGCAAGWERVRRRLFRCWLGKIVIIIYYNE